jgi:tight adherence protein B
MALAALIAGGATWCARGGLRCRLQPGRLQVGAPHRAVGARPPRAGSRLRARRRREVTELAETVAAELACGAGWLEALTRAAADGDGELCLRLRAAGDVRHALVGAAALPGAEGLQALSAAEWVSQRTGAPGGAVVGRVAEVLRAEAAAQRAVEVELAPARATTRLLAGLPAVGLLMGAGLGADPLHALLGTSPGRLCAAAAALLEVAGLLWCRAIRRRAVG